MNIKENISEELSERLKSMFVDDYDKVNGAKEDINSYLDSINVNDKYDYNSFCHDFLNISSNLLENLTDNDIQNMDFMYFINEILSVMVNYKILNDNDGKIDEETKVANLLRHELRMRGIDKRNLDDSG